MLKRFFKMKYTNEQGGIVHSSVSVFYDQCARPLLARWDQHEWIFSMDTDRLNGCCGCCKNRLTLTLGLFTQLRDIPQPVITWVMAVFTMFRTWHALARVNLPALVNMYQKRMSAHACSQVTMNSVVTSLKFFQMFVWKNPTCCTFEFNPLLENFKECCELQSRSIHKFSAVWEITERKKLLQFSQYINGQLFLLWPEVSTGWTTA